MLNWLLTPDSFEDDPVGYLLNQIGHIALGIALAWLVGWFSLLICVAWEAVHLARGGKRSDSLEDYGFVAAGVLSFGVWPWAWLVVTPFLLAGVQLRVEKGS